jgi:hypothetical protein
MIKYPDATVNYFWYDAMQRRYALRDSAGLSYFTWDRNGLDLLAERDAALIRGHERTGRPLGANRFIRRLERVIDRTLRRRPDSQERSARRHEPYTMPPDRVFLCGGAEHSRPSSLRP